MILVEYFDRDGKLRIGKIVSKNNKGVFVENWYTQKTIFIEFKNISKITNDKNEWVKFYPENKVLL